MHDLGLDHFVKIDIIGQLAKLEWSIWMKGIQIF